jgi:hypothetical protein
MNKLLGFGIAVLLCMAAAGFGAYLALRPQTAAAVAESAADATSVPQGASVATGVSEPAPAAAQAAIPETPVSITPAPARAKSPAAKPSAPPRSQSTSSGTVSGGIATVPPASDVPAAGGAAAAIPPPVPESVPLPVQEPVTPEPPAPPQKVLEELVVSADSVIGLRVENTINSEVARVEDPVEARVTRDVNVGSQVAIPAGARVLGSVIQVERGGKMKTAARIGVRFHTLVLPDSARLPLQTEAVYREGKSPGQESAAKVGAAAVGGAILGAIIGGGKGAAIGGAVGAAGGTGAMMAGGRNPAVLSAGTALTIRLNQPVTVVVEREELR